MPKEKPTEPNIADAAVDLVHGAQELRRAIRGEGVALAKKAVAGIDKVLGAIGDL